MEIIAKLDLPKQRATCPISVVLVKNPMGNYHTSLYNRETKAFFEGHYDFSGFVDAYEDFQLRCKKWLAYSPLVYELAA